MSKKLWLSQNEDGSLKHRLGIQNFWMSDFQTIFEKLNKMMTICSLCEHCSLLKMQQFCSSAYIEQFGNPVLSSMGAIMNPFDLLLGGLAHGLHFFECLSIIVPHQFPSSIHSCSTICHIREHEFYSLGRFHKFYSLGRLRSFRAKRVNFWNDGNCTDVSYFSGEGFHVFMNKGIK